jgi:hypothetical protein
MTGIFAGTEWYCAQPESEKSWQGLLQERDVPRGPATRIALGYSLVTDEGSFPVYSANVEHQLAPFSGRWVTVTGKLVDLGREGFGRELWIASIKAIEPSQA